MTKYAAPWVLRSRARGESPFRDARLIPTRLNTMITKSIVAAIRVVVEPSTQTFAKTKRVGRTGDSKHHDTDSAGWKGNTPRPPNGRS